MGYFNHNLLWMLLFILIFPGIGIHIGQDSWQDLAHMNLTLEANRSIALMEHNYDRGHAIISYMTSKTTKGFADETMAWIFVWCNKEAEVGDHLCVCCVWGGVPVHVVQHWGRATHMSSVMRRGASHTFSAVLCVWGGGSCSPGTHGLH